MFDKKNFLFIPNMYNIFLLNLRMIFFQKIELDIDFKTDTINIYRIENDSGLGPYRGLEFLKVLDYNENDTKPTPYTDFPDEWEEIVAKHQTKYFKFSFKKEKDIKKWFSKKELKIFDKYGFYVAVYEVYSYLESDKQIIYDTTQCKLIDNYSIY